MTFSRIFNTRTRSIVFTLLAASLISSCSTEDFANAVAGTYVSETSGIADTSAPGTATTAGAIDASTAVSGDDSSDAIAMFSYNADLSDAQPLNGAVLDRTTVYMFFDNAKQYSRMSFYCCKGTGGASYGEAHNASVNDSSAPFIYTADLRQYNTDGTRELYVDATRANGYDSLTANFSVYITSIVPVSPAPESNPVEKSTTPETTPVEKPASPVSVPVEKPTTSEPAPAKDPITPDTTSIEKSTVPTSAAVAMFSYNANLSDAKPLSGAVLEQKVVYMFFDNDDQYSSMEFYCCKSSNEDHKAPITSSSESLVYSIDLSKFGTTGTRELYVDATRADGHGYDSLTANFSINITKVPVVKYSNVNLSWVAPYTREDNKPISPSEIAGYTIYYGTTKGKYPESVRINDGDTYKYTVKNLAEGTYHFVITTRDSGGRESKYSSVVTKTL